MNQPWIPNFPQAMLLSQFSIYYQSIFQHVEAILSPSDAIFVYMNGSKIIKNFQCRIRKKLKQLIWLQMMSTTIRFRLHKQITVDILALFNDGQVCENSFYPMLAYFWWQSIHCTIVSHVVWIVFNMASHSQWIAFSCVTENNLCMQIVSAG